VTFSKDNQWLAAASAEGGMDLGEALVWQIPEPGHRFEEPHRLPHLDGVLCTTFSPSSQVLATGSEDQTAKVWRRTQDTWEASLPPLRCAGQVYACALSRNGRWLATINQKLSFRQSSGWSSQVCLWDISDGALIGPPIGFTNRITKLDFVDQDKRLFIERWLPPAPPERWLIDLPEDNGTPQEFLIRNELLCAQRSFLSAGAQSSLSLDKALAYATSIGPLRPLSKEECRELWFRLAPRPDRSAPATPE